MKIRLINLSGTAQVSTQLATLSPGQSTIVEVDSIDSYMSELNSLVATGLLSVVVASPSPSVVNDTIITSPLTLHVSATGNDTTGIGTLDSPFKTVQQAIYSLDGFLIRSRVTIQLGIGTFDGWYVNDERTRFALSVQASENISSNGITIQGTLVNYTPTTGTTTGTIGTSVVSNGLLTNTDLAQSWTINELRGRLVEIGSTNHVIVSNTATTFTVLSTSTQSGTYTLKDYGTIVSGNPVKATGVSSLSTVVVATNATVSTTMQVSRLKIVADATVAAVAITSARGSLGLTNVALVRQGTGSTNVRCVQFGSDANCVATRCYMSITGTNGIAISNASQAEYSSIINLINCLVTGAVGSVGFQGGGLTINTTQFEGFGTAISFGQSARSLFIGTSSNRFVSCTTAISMTGINALFNCSVSCTTNGSQTAYFDTCTTCVSISGNNNCSLGNCGGTGNTNGIVADKGATVQIGPTATLGAGSELSVDSVAGTLATLRAASPKVFPVVPNPYNTYIYE